MFDQSVILNINNSYKAYLFFKKYVLKNLKQQL